MDFMKNLTVRQILDIIEYLKAAREIVSDKLTKASTEDFNISKADGEMQSLIKERNKLDDLIATLYSIKT
ncbi:MAG: hypothetical protein E7485_06425 [Ruminococcaceae bacterium]|nr:hypothetical protein [Oscillospiraceae bacterium]